MVGLSIAPRALAFEPVDATAKATCDAAIAYFKAQAPPDSNSLALARPDQPILESYGSGLVVSYLVDAGPFFEFVQNRTLSAARYDRATLHRIGLHNLGQKFRGRLALSSVAGIHYLLKPTDFVASALMLDDLWDGPFASLAPTGFVAAIPARDILAFCDRSSAAGIATLASIAKGSARAETIS